MSGWGVIISGSACVLGGLAFLTLVAREIGWTEEELNRWEIRERDAYRRRLAEGQTAPVRPPKRGPAGPTEQGDAPQRKAG